MHRTTLLRVVLLSFTAAVIGIALSLPGRESGAAKDSAASLGIQEFSSPDGATDFTLSDFQGRPVRLKEYRGKVVMLNFWATWCTPCRSEMPSMEILYQRYKDRGFVVLAVAASEKRPDVKKFMERYRLTFPAPVDGDGTVADRYNIWSLPTTYFINTQGQVIGKVIGGRQWDSKEAMDYVSSLLKSP
jgi:peroxiredoxin